MIKTDKTIYSIIPLMVGAIFSLGWVLFAFTAVQEKLLSVLSVPVWIFHSAFLLSILVCGMIVASQLRESSVVYVSSCLLLFPLCAHAVHLIYEQYTVGTSSIVGVCISIFFTIALAVVLKYRFPVISNHAIQRLLAIMTIVLLGILVLAIRIQGYAVEYVPIWQWLIVFLPLSLIVVHNRDFISQLQILGNTSKTHTHSKSIVLFWLVLIVSTIVIGTVGRAYTLQAFSFQNDEYFHVNTAKGFNESGEFVRWDWQTDSELSAYTRASSYTWQVAQSISFFGEDQEWKFRFPSFFWGVILLITTPLLIFHITRRYEITWLLTAIIAFDNGFIWASQYTRMYSFFSVIALITVWLFWLSVREKIPTIYNSFSKELLYRIALLAVACGIAFVARDVHFTSLLLLPTFGITVFVLMFIKQREAIGELYRYMLIVVAAAILFALIRHVYSPYLPFDFVTIRHNPLYEYIFYPVKEMIAYGVSLLLFTVLALQCREYNKYPVWMIVSIFMAITVLTYFTFLGDRYDARKYAMFTYIPILLVVVAAWYSIFTTIISRIFKKENILYSSIIFVFCSLYVFVPISFPGIDESVFFRTARADKTHTELEYHDYATGYAIIEDIVENNATIAVFTPRTYYMERNDIEWIRLETGKETTIEEITALQNTYDQGWIVWPKFKREHLKKSVRSYISEEMDRYDTGDSNVVLYRWE